MFRNWKDVLIALALAVLTWYLVTGREKVEAWVDMNVEMANVPENLTIRKGLVSKIEVRVRGPKGLVRSLDRHKWTYTLDVSRLKVGENLVDIDRSRIPLSMAYEVVEVKPSRLILTVDRIVKRNVPVTAEWQGRIKPGYKLLDVSTDPETVMVQGPQRLVRKLQEAKVIVQNDFDEPPETWSDEVPIKLADGIDAEPGEVRVTLHFGPELKTAWLHVPLTLRSAAGVKAHTAQHSVHVELEAAVQLLRAAEAGKAIPGLSAVVTVPEGLRPGRHFLPYELETPEGCRVVDRQTEKIGVIVRK